MEKRWVIRDVPEKEKVQGLSKALNINARLAKLLIQRGIQDFSTAKDFFRPSLDHLHDPFLMLDMDKAVNRLCDAISSNEKILIYGDYDVDGTTSVAMMYQFLKKYTSQLVYYIPDRYAEGYGISSQGIEHAREQGIKLIISLDCGIRAVDKAMLAHSYSIDLIICDHHLPGDELPRAYAILDPKRAGDGYPFKELSGCGVGFKLLQGFCVQNSIPLEELFQMLDLVAVSTASDIVPIVDENRVLTYYGLKKLNHSPSPGLKALIDVSGLKNEIDVSAIVFYIGPRINATGRLTHAHESVRLLVSQDTDEIQAFADVLNANNTKRKDFDKSITQEALEMVMQDDELLKAKSTVLFHQDWHKGVIGIVASRCIESFYRPTIILTKSGAKATGSARSIAGFDIHEAIGNCAELLDQFGGHTHAAGLTMPIENIAAFQKKFEEVVAATIEESHLTPVLEVDLEVPLSFVNYRTYSILKQMSPFGPKNMTPQFSASKVRFKHPPQIIKNEHLRMTLIQEGHEASYPAIGFGLAEKLEDMPADIAFDIVFQIDENRYRGEKSLQLIVKDIKFA